VRNWPKKLVNSFPVLSTVSRGALSILVITTKIGIFRAAQTPMCCFVISGRGASAATAMYQSLLISNKPLMPSFWFSSRTHKRVVGQVSCQAQYSCFKVSLMPSLRKEVRKTVLPAVSDFLTRSISVNTLLLSSRISSTELFSNKV